jgi:hypothetical protein
MTLSEARKILLDATLNSNGTFTRLRLGENPGHDRIVELRIALRVIWRLLASSDSIPREIAFACGIILHFDKECHNNLRTTLDVSGDLLHSIDRSLYDLVQGAYDILSGSNAEVVQRPDLGEPISTT